MNTERAAMKGLLAEAKEQRQKLLLQVEGLCGTIRQMTNTALTPVDEIDVPQAAQMMDALVMASAELAAVNGRIARLEKELN